MTSDIKFIHVPGQGNIRSFELAATPTTVEQYTKIAVGSKYPAVEVTWFDASSYCAEHGYRLPTDAEWEYACRFGGFYPDLDDLDRYAVYERTSMATVGTKQPNNLGLYDMLGLVYEWTATDADSFRILRGGCWHSYAGSVCVADRYEYDPSVDWLNGGFRCARDI
jgi:formylglycine-generating enzyme required for sulfatase activity